MASPEPDPPDEHPDIQGFHKWVGSSSCCGVLGSSPETKRLFNPLSEVADFFQDLGRIKKILRAIFPEAQVLPNAHVIQERYKRVFCILLYSGRGKFIANMIEDDNLCDDKLPFLFCPPGFPVATADADLFQLFYNNQWRFCAPVLSDQRINLRFADDVILPTTSIEKLGDGGSAVIFKIKVHESHNGLMPKVGSGDRQTDTFVLKTYRTKEAEKYYNSEVSGFTRLMINGTLDESMIHFHGSYRQNGTFNVILEYADQGTLEDYFEKTTPPSSGEDIIAFWRNLLRVIQALVKIHNVDPTDSEDALFHGWHQDVKPSNVLVMSENRESPYGYQFKLADLGLSHFKRRMTPKEDIKDWDSYGTRAYGAPECYRCDDFTERVRLQVTPAVDIWSLGCLFSDAAVWVVRGIEGLRQYRQLRKKETDQIPNFRGGQCFHNGEMVLAAVNDMHGSLLPSIRKSDCITKSVLDCMVKEMLDVPDARPNALQLYRKATRIIDEAQTEFSKKFSTDSPSALSNPRPRTPPEPPSSSEPGSPKLGVPQQSRQFPRSGKRVGGRLPGLKGTIRARISNSDNVTVRQNKGRQQKLAAKLKCQNNAQYPADSSRGKKRYLEFTGQEQNLTQQYSPGSDQEPGEAEGSVDKTIRGAFPRRSDARGRMRKPTGLRGPPKQHTFQKVWHTEEPSTIPVLSLDEALQWRTKKKTLAGTADLRDMGFVKQYLEGRDLVFLIDDSSSMEAHWDKVVDVLLALSYMTKNLDPDGIEIHFTISTKKFKSRKTTKLLRSLKKKTFEGRSDMRSRLNSIFREYRAKLDNQSQSRSRLRTSRLPILARPMVLYILTDGVWQPQDDAEVPVRDLVGVLCEKRLDSMIGIQFIQFGNSRLGSERLKRLDKRLKLEKDIVDTEPSDGNVWKMLLGSVSPWFDGDSSDSSDDDDGKTVSSPIQGKQRVFVQRAPTDLTSSSDYTQ